MASIGTYVVGAGLVSPAGVGVEAGWGALLRGERLIGELTLFPGSPRGVLPVAEVPGLELDGTVPRTHALARIAAAQALSKAGESFGGRPDAIVLGGTTGGIPVTELLLRDGVEHPRQYRWHGAGTSWAVQHPLCQHPFRAVGRQTNDGFKIRSAAFDCRATQRLFLRHIVGCPEARRDLQAIRRDIRHLHFQQ